MDGFCASRSRYASALLLCAWLLLSGYAPAAGEVLNGDFQEGNEGFYTDFAYSPGDIYSEYTYDIVSDPSLVHPNAASYYDHTLGSGDGLMMAVNGIDEAGSPNVVWSQTVDVQPGYAYLFTCWHSLWAAGPAGLQVLVNGVPLGPPFEAGGELGEWVCYEAVWHAGTSTEAELSILNTTVSQVWNDFALDDIAFWMQTPLQRDTWAGIKAAW